MFSVVVFFHQCFGCPNNLVVDSYDLQCFSSCWASTQSEVFQLILTFFAAVAARRDSIVVLAGSFGSCHPAMNAGYLVDSELGPRVEERCTGCCAGIAGRTGLGCGPVLHLIYKSDNKRNHQQ